MNQYIGIIGRVLRDIRANMPAHEMVTDMDITLRLELYKLECAVLTEAIYFMAHYAGKGDAANIGLLEEFKKHKQLSAEIIREIEKSRVDRGLH